MIDLEHRGDIAVLTMRHGKANAMDGTFCDDLIKRLDELRTSPARAIVITGQGKIFSAGVDLVRALDGGPDYFRHFLPPLRRAFEEVFFYEKPIVVAVNGHAIAGGCVLTCTADQRLMAQGDGRIGITELLVGVPFPVIALEIMRFAATPQHFQRIVTSGATFAPGLRTHQAPDAPGGTRTARQRRPALRSGGRRHLVRAGNRRAHPRLRRAHVQEDGLNSRHRPRKRAIQ
jgi:enoyl-CoA hydratase